ncbi:hypothetical protein ELQ35_01480 [Peribacillus cavernae]|uniref:DUF401 family protein n=1 Tax=Peribacillus cavernae TaxID=1674310 RepID=A0A433HWX6_9BACI|nr:hypothetical protein [Peribacillus cavernae]MDQ0218054.1 hypothetical protein [Peribacillus cavernae]RUQ32785.1 hypothetical protein ELQ35_01480 [Peribacillus cavernae]
MLSLFGILSLLVTFFYMKPRVMILPLFLTISSIAIMLLSSKGNIFPGIWEGILQMRALISLLFIVPIVSWVLRYEPYIEEVMIFSRKHLNNSKSFYGGIMSVTQLVSYFIIIGAVPIMFQFVHTFLKGKKGEIWDTFKATTVLRGFALSSLWIISVPSFSYAVQSTGASLSIAILQGFSVSLAGTALAIGFLYFQEKKDPSILSKGIQEEFNRVLSVKKTDRITYRIVIEFIILFLSLLVPIFVIHLTLHWDLLIVIPLVVLAWTFIYFLTKRDLYRFFTEGKYYITRGVPQKGKEMSIFFSAGLLIYALNISGWGKEFVEGVYYLTEKLPLINFLWVLPLIIVMLGSIGLGPLMSMVLVGGIIQNIDSPYPPELILISLTIGSALSIMLSPLVAPVIILSGANGRSPWNNSFKNNWAYACTFYLLVEAYVQLMLWSDIL